MIAWPNAGRDLGAACRLACLGPEKPKFSPKKVVLALASTWVAIPPEVRGLLDRFQKPAEAAHIVWALMGSMFLDLGTSGRRLRVHLPPEEIGAALTPRFGLPALAFRDAEVGFAWS